ncbi:dihydroxyacetone kinase DhaL subunit [Mesocricetibacter intestinalis]|uniref:Dihydroxyacetone kinase DhaL subunit n=1 Tax=Mesocricetibacter intestinalis TaxID=1521930 RepID=A0A4R6VBW9_9PAST|nr:dihydroxyacetone kinase subunit DhaL [Mesocricetibacter intestinalis]TDQ59717.1 dihydroxyacetone kinase DhaL subunit [Mesocricetibacter intestinalis]
MILTKQQILNWLENCHHILSEKKDELTQLDTAIGDGDHGVNMQRGFAKVAETLPNIADKNIGSILKSVGMTLLSQVGGASGPLYGTFFIKGGQRVLGKESLTFAEFHLLLQEGVQGIIARGRAESGDKTMCDVWLPLLKDLEGMNADAPAAVILKEALQKAEQYSAATLPLIAKKGRASYLGSRSAGHLDPGAASTVYILRALYDAVKQE